MKAAFDTRKSATARVFSNNYNSDEIVTSYEPAANQQQTGSGTVYVAHAYSDYSDPQDSIGRAPSGSSPTAHAYSSGQSSSISGFGGPGGANVRRSASSAVETNSATRDKYNNYVQSDWNINYSQSGVYVPNKDGGYTRISKDAIGDGNSADTDAAAGGVAYSSPYSGKPYGHGVFIARRLSDAGSITEREKQQEKRSNVSEAWCQYEDLDAIHQNASRPQESYGVKRSASDVTHLRRSLAPKSPSSEAIYAYPDKVLKRQSSGIYAYSTELPKAIPDTPSSPPPPPIPPPPPLSPDTPSSLSAPTAQPPAHHETTLDAVRRKREEMQAIRLSTKRPNTASEVGSGHGYANEGEYRNHNYTVSFIIACFKMVKIY